jgi:subtilisin-like proprotein convertase family protein
MLSFTNSMPGLVFILCFLTTGLSAQSNPWRAVEEGEFATQAMDRSIIPQKYLTYALDMDELQVVLERAPMRFSPESYEAVVILQLPMPNGATERFRIFDAPIMQTDLAARYPLLHAYAGVGIDDPTASLRFNITQFGFHALILSGRHSPVYIDPYSKSDTRHYLTYYKSDYQKAESRECHFGEEQDLAIEDLPLGSSQSDCNLRTYRLALACTTTYADFHGGNKPDVMAAFHTTMTRVNGIFEREVAVSMMLVANNDELIFIEDSPYSDETSFGIFDENQVVCDDIIGTANYDIGHVFAHEGGSVALGGAAYRSAACVDLMKASAFSSFDPPVGDPFDIDFVAHEMGHQLGCSHTASNNCNSTRATSVEPSDASTIMGQYFCDLPNIQANNDAYFHAVNLLEIGYNTTEGPAGSCPTLTDTGNTPPEVEVEQQRYVLPISTPFKLEAIGQDADGDVLTYCWEQMDNEMIPNPPIPESEAGPAFRSYEPVEEPYRIFPALEYLINGTDYQWEVLPAVSREMDFRVTVRDNFMGAGCTSEADVDLTFDEGAGPFLVQSPNSDVVWYEGASYTISWDVANTDMAPVNCSQVDILLSTDGGYTYPVNLATNVPNDGAHIIEVPEIPSSTVRVMVRCSDNLFFDISDEDFSIATASNPALGLAVDAPVQQACQNAERINYQLSFSSIAGFDEEVTLSASGIPSGASFSFSSSSFIPPANINLDIEGLENVAPGAYTIDINASSASSDLGQEVILELEQDIPEPILLTTPANGASGVSLRPDFNWSGGGNDPEYIVEIARTPGFGQAVVEVGRVNTEAYTPTVSLAPLTVYYWRVRTQNSCNPAEGAPWFSFQTGGEGCYIFTKSDPAYVHGYVDTETSELTVGHDLSITDVNVQLEIFHKNIGDLSVSLTAPSGTSVELFNRPGVPATDIGCSRDDMLLIFDDESSNSAEQLENTCINGQEYGIEGTFQPMVPLANFNGQPSAGVWTLNISDDKFMHAGSVDNWSLELCFDQDAANPPAFSKMDLAVPENGSALIQSNNLLASTSENSPEEIIYTIVSIPSAGDLNYNGSVAMAGTTFSQASINGGALSYTNTNPDAGTDQFSFDIATPQGGWIQGESLNLNIGEGTSVRENSSSLQFDLFPNPSTGVLNLNLAESGSQNLKLQLYSISGTVIYETQIDPAHRMQELDMEEVPPGVYLVVLSNGAHLGRKKWIKI